MGKSVIITFLVILVATFINGFYVANSDIPRVIVGDIVIMLVAVIEYVNGMSR